MLKQNLMAAEGVCVTRAVVYFLADRLHRAQQEAKSETRRSKE